ncbi:transposase [Aerococcus urinaehominis]|uniref:Mutator family transposase n=1 Tax=Aerococcus urinaehominis TaxID=128944 RepID=A0A0X8FM73_9LACT|nr:IS256 family transposase [Aerococcus urinaehominis]AMB99845.1 transposase [Aerococcus urinaehominis]
MAQLNITLNLEEITEAVLNSDMDQMMKSLTVTIFNAYMQAEREEFINAKRYERTDDRKDYRNGSYKRNFKTKVGTVELDVPRTRSGEFDTKLFDKYQRMDKAFVAVLTEMYINGVSTRRIKKVVETLCGEGVSKSFVSSVNKNLDPAVFEFKGRSLTHTNFRYVYVDAMYIKVRENHRSVFKGVYIAQGINDDNRREIIGFMIADNESEENWKNFFLDLKARGLTKPTLIISDAHKGLKSAISNQFLGTTWQRCTVHFLRNILAHFPKKDCSHERSLLKRIFNADSQQRARELKFEFVEYVSGNEKYDKAVNTLEEGFEDAIPYLLEPTPYRVSLKTTNSLERLNREIRRREKVVGLFPNIEAAERLIGSVLLDLHEYWETCPHKFFNNIV